MMKILLDEMVPRDLRTFILGHDVYSVQYMGWGSFKNGVLLKKADPVFDAFITVDQSLQFQQNFAGYKMCFVILEPKRNIISHLIPMLPELHRQLALLQIGSGTAINILPP